MLQIVQCVFLMSVMTCQTVSGCYFFNCPNEFSWSKKNDDSAAIMRMVMAKSQSIGDPKKLFHCKDVSIGGEFPQCEFRGTQVCCGSDVYGSRDCNAFTTEPEPLEDMILKRITKALQVYMNAADPDKLADRKLCVKVGICCDGENCKPEVTCTSSYQDESDGEFPMEKLNHLIKVLLKSNLPN